VPATARAIARSTRLGRRAGNQLRANRPACSAASSNRSSATGKATPRRASCAARRSWWRHLILGPHRRIATDGDAYHVRCDAMVVVPMHARRRIASQIAEGR